MEVGAWLPWAAIVTLQEASDGLMEHLKGFSWLTAMNTLGNTAVVAHPSHVKGLNVIHEHQPYGRNLTTQEIQYRDEIWKFNATLPPHRQKEAKEWNDPRGRWRLDFVIVRAELCSPLYGTDNLVIASIHVETTLARKAMAAEEDVLSFLSECFKHRVDLIGLDGNQSIYPRWKDSELSIWQRMWRRLCTEHGLELPHHDILGIPDAKDSPHSDDFCGDCVGFWIPPWSALKRNKGGVYGLFDIPRSELGIRERDNDSHYIAFLRLKTKKHGKRSAEAEARNRERSRLYRKAKAAPKASSSRSHE